MPTRRRGKRGGTEIPKRRRPIVGESWRRCLYLLFDDWRYGYTIRKVNLSPPSQRHQQTAVLGNATVRRFPLPLFRLMAPRRSSKYFVSAFHPSFILAMHPREAAGESSERFFPMFDIRSQSFSSGPGQEPQINPIYLPVGNKLFTMTTLSFGMLCLEMPKMSWSSRDLPMPPFEVADVTSYSLLPDQRTFLVSTKMGTTLATFAFDTKELSWTRLGYWPLPFAGRGHFDPHLNALVGLSKDAGTLGQFCSCDVPSSYTGDRQCSAPAWKLCREKLFSKDPSEKHVGATLVYMGGKSKFCLVQCLSIKGDTSNARLPGVCLYRVTVFFLRPKKNGDLRIGKRQVQYYKVPEATTQWFLLGNPVAFWM